MRFLRKLTNCIILLHSRERILLLLKTLEDTCCSLLLKLMSVLYPVPVKAASLNKPLKPHDILLYSISIKKMT